MNSANDSGKLAAQYRSWTTEDLVRATTLEAEEYTPEAVSLMREELQGRNLTAEAQEALEGRVEGEATSAQRSLVGIRGWLLVFVVLFGLNFGVVLVSDIFALAQPLPGIAYFATVLEIFVGIYALGALWLLVSRHPRAPQHAQAVLVIFCFLAIGSWLAFHWRGYPPGLFPVGAVGFACVWWSYLSYSRRVRLTYSTRAENLGEVESAG